MVNMSFRVDEQTKKQADENYFGRWQPLPTSP